MHPTIAAPAPLSLRSYQKQFIADVYTRIRAGEKRILGVAPTGAGKTLISSQMVSHAVSKGRRILFVVHRDILIAQTYDKLCKFGLSDCGFIKSGWQENREALVQIASVQTLCKRNWWHEYPADVVILDECHLVAFAAVVQQMMQLIYPQAIYLGLTATPWRLSKRESLGDCFQALVCAPMPHDLIDSGFLVKPGYFSPSQADLESVGTTVSGDFDEGQLALACDRPELIQQIVRDWHNLAYPRRTIAFAVNVNHSQHLRDAFLRAGIPAAHVDGTMHSKVANQIYEQLSAGEILVLCSCMKLVEGFDVPSVSAVLLCRPTQSKALHFQQIGRGLRLCPETDKRDCIVIDQAGNILRHGFVEDLKAISLDRGEDAQEGEVPKKICPPEQGGCAAILYASVPRCPKCGYVFPKPKKVYFVPTLQHMLSEEDFERHEFYCQHIKTAYQRNFVPGWAAITFKDRFGHWPPDAWARGAVFGDHPTQVQRRSYYRYLQAIAQRKEKSEAWVERYMSLEFGFRGAHKNE